MLVPDVSLEIGRGDPFGAYCAADKSMIESEAVSEVGPTPPVVDVPSVSAAMEALETDGALLAWRGWRECWMLGCVRARRRNGDGDGDDGGGR